MDFKDVPEGLPQALVGLATTRNYIMTQAIMQHYAAFLEKQFGIPTADTIKEIGELYHSNPVYKVEQEVNNSLIALMQKSEEMLKP